MHFQDKVCYEKCCTLQYTLTAFAIHGSVDINEAHGLAAGDEKTNTNDK